MVGPRNALTRRSEEGQSHTVLKTVTVAWSVASAAAGVGLHVVRLLKSLVYTHHTCATAHLKDKNL